MNRARISLFVLAMAMLSAAGCQEDITEVLVIVNSDLRPFLDFETVTFSSQAGSGTPPASTICSNPATVGSFPVSVGFVSEGNTAAFSVKIQLGRNFNQELVVSRTISGIRFVSEQLRMLSVELKAACKCVGTSCPNPGTNPDCDTIENPATVPFDPLVAPAALEFNNPPCQEGQFFSRGL